ncbi:hypothetical protein SAMN02799620_04755 [Mycolicibacterium fluoranthenivorans]|uniref:Uncharacterized protein n=2 Tax=Mycolicibacterium fluoranthenivorans TaxID=258505 RepID=A0A1G4WTC4_9MYCO|nr:hypothetical protein SAMN02799620_04755 [Mycolicibacterium fluoranthenivorans]
MPMPTDPQKGVARRWGVIAAATVFIVVLAAVGTVVVLKTIKADPRERPSDWHPPLQPLLASSMQVQPIVGWRTPVLDVGPFPSASPDTVPTELRFATNVSAFDSTPFVGSTGDRAYFRVGDAGSSSPQWWLIGIDVRDGGRLFPAVPLPTTSRPPQCYLNGPDALLCIENATENVRFWTIDGHTGAVTHTGFTPLRTYTGNLGVQQVGIYALATTQSEGVRGIGSTAETTWSVPGNGDVDQGSSSIRDIPPIELATQKSGRAADTRVVFSIANGTIVSPRTTDGSRQLKTTVYPGGFAAEVSRGDERPTVQFFDESGGRVGQEVPGGTLADSVAELPVVALAPSGWAAYSAQGEKLLQQPGAMPAQTRLIGSTLYAMGDSGWHQYNLVTGAQGKDCSYGLGEGGYIASDGKAAVLTSGNATVGLETSGVDLASCNTLWTTNSAPGSFRHVWRINTTLVQLSDDGKELMSLVAPS